MILRDHDIIFDILQCRSFSLRHVNWFISGYIGSNKIALFFSKHMPLLSASSVCLYPCAYIALQNTWRKPELAVLIMREEECPQAPASPLYFIKTLKFKKILKLELLLLQPVCIFLPLNNQSQNQGGERLKVFLCCREIFGEAFKVFIMGRYILEAVVELSIFICNVLLLCFLAP